LEVEDNQVRYKEVVGNQAEGNHLQEVAAVDIPLVAADNRVREVEAVDTLAEEDMSLDQDQNRKTAPGEPLHQRNMRESLTSVLTDYYCYFHFHLFRFVRTHSKHFPCARMLPKQPAQSTVSTTKPEF
jgi:hypothetical protein